mgnify:FL=1
MRSPDLERVAETHFFIRPVLNASLKRHVLTPDGQLMSPGCGTYFDAWTQSLSDKFFDMGTLIRAAASIETSLRNCYMGFKGHSNLSALHRDPDYHQNIFQRVMPWQDNGGAIALMRTVGVDLTTFSELRSVQELVLHRHLYAHNLGVLDDRYIENLKTLTGTDIRSHPNVAHAYPHQDVFWFEPLGRLPQLIEDARSFLRGLP